MISVGGRRRCGRRAGQWSAPPSGQGRSGWLGRWGRRRRLQRRRQQRRRELRAPRGLSAFSRAAEFGIRSYNELTKLTAHTGLRAHHLIEKRFAERLGLEAGKIPSIALTPEEHQVFTNAWRQAIGYIGDRNPITTANATLQDVWIAAQRIYADYPELLEAVRQTLFGK